MASILVPVPQPPYSAPIADKNGMMTFAWTQWIQQVYQRIGGASALSNTAVAATTAPLFSGYAANTNTLLYTSATGITTIIDSMTAKNNGITALTISVNFVPLGGTPSLSNLVVSSQVIPAGATVSLTGALNRALSAGGFVSVVASAGAQIVVNGSGRQVS